VRILLDALPLQVRSAGIAVYTESLVRELAAARPDAELILFGMAGPLRVDAGNGPIAPWPGNVRWQRSLLYPLIMGAPLMQLPRLLPLEMAHPSADVFHATNYTAPRTRRTPLVVTVHDLALARFPELGTPTLRRLVGRVRRTAAAARRVIADSESTARDLRELLSVAPEKIRVVYPGCPAHFRPLALEACAPVLRRHGVTPPYLLHVGTLEPRKNLVGLLRAYRRVAAAHADAPGLVLAGARGWGTDAVLHAIEELGLRERVTLTGAVPSSDLPALYGAAAAFVYPSLYEGFGFPVLEAMACATPVITADVASLPEVVGDAALRVDPRDDAALAAAITRVLTDQEIRESLRRAGPARARTFTWERCARETLAVYGEALRGA
jgi:glycosyltransferase involved in cell wall biosynthesis